MTLNVETLAEFSLHCVARRYERAADTTDAAIFADMRMLLQRHDRLAAAAEDFDVAAGEGRWVGNVVRVKSKAHGEETILAARTYLPITA